MIPQWNPVQGAITAYRQRYAAGNSGESAEPWAVRAALAAGALGMLRPLGLKDAYPRLVEGTPRAFGGDPPFFFTRPLDNAPNRFEQRTLGGDVALGPVPGGEVVLHRQIEACIALGPLAGDPALLEVAADEWLFNLAWFFSLNRQLGGLVPDGIGLENSAPTTGGVHWGGDWFCVRWPLPLYLMYLMPAAG